MGRKKVFSSESYAALPGSVKLLILLLEATLLSVVLTIIIRKAPKFFYFIFYPVPMHIPIPFNLIFGGSILFLCLALNFWANFTMLHRNKISLKNREPFHIPETLVINGPFKFSRNPIYLSVIGLLISMGILFSSITALLSAVIIFFVFHYWLISWEEQTLQEVFGEEYITYKQQVRRWV